MFESTAGLASVETVAASESYAASIASNQIGLAASPSNEIVPFWRKVGDSPSFAPDWYANKGPVTLEVHYDSALTPAENGAALKSVLSNLSAGEHIKIHAGEYFVDSFFTIEAAGTAQNPVTIAGAPGEVVVITRSDVKQNVVNIFPSQYLIIEGLELIGGSTGIKLQEVDHFMLHDVEISQTDGNGIAANSKNTSYLYFIDNEIHDTGGNGEGLYLGAHDGSHITHHSYVIGNYIYNLNARDVGQGDGIEIKDGSYANTIKHNFVQNTNYPGIVVYRTGRAIEDRNVIEENVVINSNDTAIQATADALIQNNLIVTNRTGFLSKPFATVPQNLSIVNNTIVAGTDGIRTFGWDDAEAVNNIFANNAVYSAAGRPIPNGLGNAISTGNAVITDLAEAFSDVRLDEPRWDATPLANTELIGRSDPQYAPTHDLFGNARVTGNDIGAIDFAGIGGELPEPEVPVDGVYGRFDFGTETSPVESGYTKITALDRYDYVNEYGWLNGSVGSRDRVNADDLDRDFNYVSSGSMTFAVEVPNGIYQLSMVVGDASYESSSIEVEIEHQLVDTISTVAGEFVNSIYEVEVTDRLLSLRLTRGTSGFAMINSLQVTRVQQVPAAVIVKADLGLSTTESQGTASFTVELRSQPTHPVTIDIRSSDVTEGTVSTRQLTFNDQNWNMPQTVTLTGVDDSLHDGNVSYQVITSDTVSSDPNYNGLVIEDISLSNIDDEIAGPDPSLRFDFGTIGSPVETGYVQVTPLIEYESTRGYGWLNGNVGSRDRGKGSSLVRDFNHTASGAMTFAVDVPDGDYQVKVTVADPFYSNRGMQVVIEGQAVDTLSIDGGDSLARTYDVIVRDGQLTLTIMRGTTGFAIINSLEVIPKRRFDAGVLLKASPVLFTTEKSGSAQFTVELLAPPTEAVTILLNSSDVTEGVLSATHVVFNPLNWNQPQTVIVTGVDDDVQDGDVIYQIITSSASSLDSAYQGLDVDDVSLVNQDDDSDEVGFESIARFDFGSSSSPVEGGYTQVVPADRYNAVAGYGWLSGAVGARDRVNATDLDRDFNHVASGEMVFAVDLANGVYRVTVSIGDRYYGHEGIGISIEGETVQAVSIGPNEFISESYLATIADGQLTLKLTRGQSGFALLNSLLIERQV
ncbi:right-handed parallel beta-helix repeat-containing protein [Rubripirellula reticaptiva]|nr:right-handed parallel beta-helix repeat-containing protein [Rubripirellula reticaptiva]